MTTLFLALFWLSSPVWQGSVPGLPIQIPAQVPVQQPASPQPQAPPSAQAPNQQPGSQAAGATSQASASYEVGPGDSFRVLGYTGNEPIDQTVVVGSDGTSFIPFSVNQLIKVEGMTANQIRDVIQTAMRQNYRNPVVQVITSSIQSKKAMLIGDATSGGNRSGFFPITGEETVMEFVVQNGGYVAGSNLSGVQVTRKDTGKIEHVDLYDTLLNGGKSGYLPMEPNDIVYIPSLQNVSNKVFMINEGRSGAILQTPDKLTLLEALTRGGSTVAGSRLEDVYVIRVDPKDPTKTPLIQKIRFTDLFKKGNYAVNITLENNDIVYVPKSRTLRISDVVNAVTPVMSFIQNLFFYASAFKTGG